VAHGTPDWGLVGPKKTVYGLDDMAELAVRLGSPHLWDRRGDVFIQDSFEDGLGRWDRWSWPPNNEVCLAADHAGQGAYSVLLKPGTTAGANWAHLSQWHGTPATSKLGFEYRFNIPDNMLYWHWRLAWYTGAEVIYAHVCWRYATRDVRVYDNALGWVTFASSLSRVFSDQPTHIGKMVVDYTARRYVRFILNHASYDLSAYTPQIGADSSQQAIYVYLALYAEEGKTAEGYVDCIILTHNEP